MQPMNAIKTRGRALLPIHVLEDLEEELVAALYEQRSLEFQIMEYTPQDSAPQDLRESFRGARVRVNQLEAKIRYLKHSC